MKSILPIFIPSSEIPVEDLKALIDNSNDLSTLQIAARLPFFKNKGFKGFAHKEIIPIAKSGDKYVLEMFHGETGAFKVCDILTSRRRLFNANITNIKGLSNGPSRKTYRIFLTKAIKAPYDRCWHIWRYWLCCHLQC